MKSVYTSPFRVYLIIAALALVGLYSGFRLPISLFPNSTKPEIGVWIPFGQSTAVEFLDSYGWRIEQQLDGLQAGGIRVESIEANYWPRSVRYVVSFGWGAPPNEALKEVRNVVNSFSGQLSRESREGKRIYTRNENSGFFAATFYSPVRDLNELYKILEPLITPKIGKVEDALMAVLWNPQEKEIRIELVPEAMASLQLFPGQIERAITPVLGSFAGGSVTQGSSRFQIQMPRQLNSIDDLKKVTIPTPSGQSVHLSDIGRIYLAPKSGWSRAFKTDGSPSLIL